MALRARSLATLVAVQAFSAPEGACPWLRQLAAAAMPGALAARQ